MTLLEAAHRHRMTFDAESFLCIAHWNRWRVVRTDRDGKSSARARPLPVNFLL